LRTNLSFPSAASAGCRTGSDAPHNDTNFGIGTLEQNQVESSCSRIARRERA
jgi:hypothetical protein